MFLSVIVPTCDRYAMLSKCLNALSPQIQGLSPETYEIIVSDDSAGEAQKSRLEADFPWVLWNKGPQRGPSANRNSGAEVARGDWLVFIDDDCVPEAAVLASYLEAAAQNPHLKVFEGAIHEDRPRYRMDEESPINETGGLLWSCNFMIQRKLFQQLNGFCELFPYAGMEDVDLRERLKQIGESFLFVPKAGVIHPWRPYHDEKTHLETRVVSERLFYARHPALRVPTIPALFGLIHGELKDFLLGFRLRYRGLGRWLARCWTNRIIVVMCRRPAPASDKPDPALPG